MVENTLGKKNLIFINKLYRFPDGTFKILRPNGEEVNFSNNSIQRKDKLGRVVVLKNIF